ncbi:serine/threonine-protein kinase 3-like [Schistocerca gregaria]|uniref:serine/threonine-protein kinase 3-like n=1 Tax=Schistocerca gregaria TaxID=7010 RepID=UPI00211DB0A8|nr:serine/threonine-protein kinase 3-like [Schistocerca gregaria]XP_049848689.1 serine/threonine-protein kinase 3-like [Schistocerca gregaria]
MGIEAQDSIGEVLAKVGGTGEKSIEESQTRDESIKQLEREFASRDPEKVFKIQGELGKETGSHVYRAIHRETKKVVAIKKMTVAGANIVTTLKEIYTMKELKSEYTLKYYGCYHKNNCIWVVMQYCDGGSVQDIIDARENEDICFTERQIAEIVTQVLKALEYLHSLKKIHRDVKAANILLSSDGTVKLTDFSLSAQQIGDEKRTTTIGSCYWMAPETLMGSGYDSKADIWSLGITVLEMAEGIPPLIEEKPHRAVFRIVNDPPPKLYCPSAWSNEFNDFISRCLVKNPEYRPTSTELLKHPFVVNAKNGRQSIIELVQCNQKGLKKEKGLHVEEEVELSIWINDVEKKLVIPSHATSEDVCRQLSTSHDLDQNSCQLWVVIKDLNKTKEKKLGPYERPAKVSSDLRKKLKLEKKGPSSNRASYRFVLKEGNRIKTKK